mmetsp:Transcript_11071/g.11177  ORF Transcript_11071/g.11177 Transcript_11071/m.11177 type:complete len:210 (-) Transcript_11071:247-876(-)|eukprot:CAMPEP_0171295186 /NCGR_PEP_ID=MMETSP0816-20121228/3793_1 /TAXON_ID=420281 /ORGANISM="Proboscia inermis, Strain CCAP1064/1" /LENGTH=209 /DNA_ID=CAMNT_0011767677 /DNA_START=48 /DNA_END=677 /DNA_ORIENTATION=-
MMKIVISAILAGAASAFAPQLQPKASSSLAVNELELGVTEPLGVFDPLGWLDTQPEAFERRRAVERKHGRIAMAAVIGTIVHNNKIVFDGYISPSQNLKFADIPEGFMGFFSIPTAGIAQIIFIVGFVELAWLPASQYDGDYGVGYFGNDLDPEEKARKLNVELNNGRAAMLGIIGNMVGEGVTGQTMAEQYAAGHFNPFNDGTGVLFN